MSQDGREFLCCEYNRDGDSYRSPWSRGYYPALEGDDEPFYPQGDLAAMEVVANELFAKYAKLYYDKDFITSVYFFDTGSTTGGYGSCWLVKKSKLAFCEVILFL